MTHMSGKTMKFLDAAIHIADRLVNDAVWHENRCTWMGDDVELIDGDWKVVYQTVDAYLYSGNAGIARFLILSWQETDEEHFIKTALGAIESSLYDVEHSLKESLPIGLYDGLLGIVLVAAEIDSVLPDSPFHDRIAIIINEISRRISVDDDLDIADLLSGSAGNLIGLIKLSGMIEDISLTKECSILADKLIDESHITPYGLYWDKIDGTNIDAGLSGLAHGASGIAYALNEYGRSVEKTRYCNTAQRGFLYERSWFNRKQSNWADIRSIEEENNKDYVQKLSYPVFWCHGAGGIGLARLRAYRLTHDKTMLAEASAALHAATTEAKKVIKDKNLSTFNLSVCHGLGSIIDLFLYAYQVLEEETFLKRARYIGSFSLDISKIGTPQEYWSCGIHGGGETPGLMMGLSGIGYNFLRLYNPEVYTSPVGLEVS